MSETTGMQAVFASDEALQDAIGRLTTLGFDRSDLTVSDQSAASAAGASEASGSAPTTETDTRQARTLATSMAGTAGAFVAAGLTIATGGAAAVAAGAALAAGAGAAGAANLTGSAASQATADQRQQAAERGALTLIVQLRTPDKAPVAEAALRDAGGQDVTRLIPAGSVTSASWTG